jgi:hypothetical protein
MPRPTLEDATAGLDSSTVAILGDRFSYKPADGAYGAVNGFVGHEEVRQDFGGSSAVVQGITVELFRVDAPVRPNAACRVQLPKLPNQTFQPTNVRLNEAGTGWKFELKTVAV